MLILCILCIVNMHLYNIYSTQPQPSTHTHTHTSVHNYIYIYTKKALSNKSSANNESAYMILY